MWISNYVFEALLNAKKSGFKVNLEKEDISLYLDKYENAQIELTSYEKLHFIKLYQMIDDFDNSARLLVSLKKTTGSLHYKLEKERLKQIQGFETNISFIDSCRKETMFGNVYFEEVKDPSIWRNQITENTIQNTLLVYQIFKNDSTKNHDEDLKKMRNYLLEKRTDGYWENTYTSAKIIATIIGDILDENDELIYPELEIKGSIQKTITDFPMSLTLQKGEEISIQKKGNFPIYFTQYEKYWESNPTARTEDFEVTSYFSNSENNTLIAGEEVELIVEVNVKKASDYVMVNVPIPAGCSYASKKKGNYYEVHREYYKNETAIFCKKLKEGHYTFKVKLLPRYSGVYHINPAKAELMYFPTFYGNNQLRKINIDTTKVQ